MRLQYLVCQHPSPANHLDRTEVAQLDVSSLVDQNVVGLDI